MNDIQIISTVQNKADQKKAIHYSSSTVFLALCSSNGSIDTEISLLNHFVLKRKIMDVVATVEIRELGGELIESFKLILNKKKVYSIILSEHLKRAFVGSVYIFFKSKENLAVPFCAVMCSIKSQKSICGVHTYGRRLEQKEYGTSLDLNSTIETGWTARDTDNIKSFAVLHGGVFDLELDVKLEISNSKNIKLYIFKKFKLKAFSTLIIIPQNLSNDIISHLRGKKGHIKIYIEGLKGIFPRMLCGNYLIASSQLNELNDAKEIQFTHTNFDFSTIKQPDASGRLGYHDQPFLPGGYAIVYPVETKKSISIGENKKYISNSMQHFKVESLSQIKIKSESQNLPSRFVTATIGNWDGSILESECSSGIIVEDQLLVKCHWHWGLLKPSFDDGEGVISIIQNKFSDNKEILRTLKLRLFSEEGKLLEKDIVIDGHIKINMTDLLKTKQSRTIIWYVLSGDKLEDLHVFSTFFPIKKSGFVEHAF